MGRARIRIFGVNFVAPKGLRKSPGRSPFNSCVAMELSGKKAGSRSAQMKNFAEAARKCKGTK